MDALPISDIESIEQPSQTVAFTPLGRAITASEVAERLSANLYSQLSEKSDAVTLAAVARAQIYAGSVFRRLGVRFSLDDTTQREVVLILTVYEMHIALGHEEAGREYRLKAKDIILAAYGDYPDTDSTQAGKTAVAHVSGGRKQESVYRRAFTVGNRYGRR